MTAGNGDAQIVVRWIIGLVIVVQMAITGWLANKVEKMEGQLYAYRSESSVTLLQERLANWVPVIQQSHDKITDMDKELTTMRQIDSNQDRRIDRLEARTK